MGIPSINLYLFIHTYWLPTILTIPLLNILTYLPPAPINSSLLTSYHLNNSILNILVYLPPASIYSSLLISFCHLNTLNHLPLTDKGCGFLKPSKITLPEHSLLDLRLYHSNTVWGSRALINMTFPALATRATGKVIMGH